MRTRPIVWLGTLVLVLVLGGCGDVDGSAIPGMEPTTDFRLSTHCGIHELATDDGRFFVRAEGPLTDGNGNPPPGWDNPFQEGHLVVTDDVAVFTDDAGHRERFLLRPGASTSLRICS